MTAPKKAVIFDFGGVIFKTVDYTPRHKWDDRLGLPPGSVERVVHNDSSWLDAQTGRITTADYWRDVAERLNLGAEEVAELAADFYSGDVVDKTIVAYIKSLRTAGHPVALLSNDSLDLVPRLEELALTALFDPLVISARIGVMKPAAGAYEAVLDGLGYPPGATIFIDDRAENVEGAANLGIHAVHYTAGMDLPGTLAPLLSK